MNIPKNITVKEIMQIQSKNINIKEGENNSNNKSDSQENIKKVNK